LFLLPHPTANALDTPTGPGLCLVEGGGRGGGGGGEGGGKK